LNNAIRINNKFWVAYKLLGDIYFQKLQYEKAIDSYQTALALGKEDAVIYNDIGLALIQLERYREATTYLEKAFSRDPGNVNIHYSLASAYRDAGLSSKALAEYTAIASYNSTYPYLFNDIGEIYRNKGERVASLEAFNRELVHANERLRSDPDNPVFLDSLAGALNGLGKYGEAKVIIEKAIKLNPRFRQAYLTLARIYEDSGNKKEALDTLNKAKSFSGKAGFIDRDIYRLRKETEKAQDNYYLPIHTIYLKNGRRIDGSITEQDSEKVIIMVTLKNSSGQLVLYKNAIDRICAYGE
ncbi:MAG: tetratricopeptide repeat protein, partial [Candidatus Omnitrophica bacterium]|nr:tetratricopeptide repeat protein [Candidatus Omnitrophota bacterium]